jgi:hypothetical protein
MCRELLESSPERAFSWLLRRWRSVFRRHGDQDSEAMPITCSELMAIRSERSDASGVAMRFSWEATARSRWSKRRSIRLVFSSLRIGGSLRDCGLNSPASNNRRPLLDGRIQEFAKPGLCNLHLPRTYGEPPFIYQHSILQTSHMTSSCKKSERSSG